MLTLSFWVSLSMPLCTGGAGMENLIKKAWIAGLPVYVRESAGQVGPFTQDRHLA